MSVGRFSSKKLRGFVLIGLAVLLLFSLAGGASAFFLALSRGDSIFLATESGEPLLVARGYDPEISPDGRLVAFTLYSEEGDRQIAVIDGPSKEPRLFPSVPGENSYGPRWAPDGKTLLFNHWDEKKSEWVLALLTLDDETFHPLAPESEGLYSPFWAADGQSVYGQDLESLCRIDIASGRFVEKRDLAPILGEAMASSALRFSLSSDGTKWLFDGDVEDKENILKGGEGLMSAVFVHIPAEGTTRRLTDDLSASHPTWLPGCKAFLFASYEAPDSEADEPVFNLYRQALDNGEATLFLGNGSAPSASR